MHYHSQGLCFEYPPTWALTEESSELQRSITLQTAGASFWTITVFENRPDPEQILDSVLQAFQDDYENVDVYPVQASLNNEPVTAVDLDFIYLDMVNSVCLRAFQTETSSVLVMYQGTDQELEQLREKFETVTGSLKFED